MFEYAQSTIVLEGRAVQTLLPVLLPLLDGRRTVDEINEVVGRAAAPAVAHALTLLDERGLLIDGPALPESMTEPAADTVHFLAATTHARRLDDPAQLLARVKVAVAGAKPLGDEIADLLRASGLTDVSQPDWTSVDASAAPHLVVAAPTPPELPRLEEWNRRALAARTPWLQVLPFDGRMTAIGPLYVPGETACYECYRRRRAANVAYPVADYWALEASPASYPSPPPLRHMAVGLAAMLALQWLSDRLGNEAQSRVPATMHALTWSGTVQLDSHPVHRVPRCPVCFPDDLGTPSPWHD